MFFEDDEREYKLVAPDVEALLDCFDHYGIMNPTESTEALLAAFEKVNTLLAPLAPLRKNEEAKSIWIRVPRGTIEDFGNCYYTFEEAKDAGEVQTYEEYEEYWKQEYPEETVWLELVTVKSFNNDGTLRYYGLNLGHRMVISALTEARSWKDRESYAEGAAIRLCEVILPAVQESIGLLKAGKYNALVQAELPYQFRVGVIRHADLRKYEPEDQKRDYDGLNEETVQRFREMIASGINDVSRIGRIRNFTANDFFRACRIGYEAIGKDCSGFTLPELYQHYADGRDEGLTGLGHGLNEGPGIDPDSSTAWDEWYNGKRFGGHPWEVVPGGNSTHMELYVHSDKKELHYQLLSGEITQEEYDEKIQEAGYYFEIVGLQRQFESVSFYVALTDAGYPVIIEGAEELIARFDATDYIGIVPHHMPNRYCESLFPEKYGNMIDFTYVYKDEDPWFEKVEWLPEEPAVLMDEDLADVTGEGDRGTAGS